MPPQDPTSTQIPGSDVLKETLRRSKITDEQRQQIWDAYHVQGEEKDFVNSLNKISGMDPDSKQTLYDMRYKGFKNLGNQVTPQAPATPAQQSKKAEPSSLSSSASRLKLTPPIEPEYTAVKGLFGQPILSQASEQQALRAKQDVQFRIDPTGPVQSEIEARYPGAIDTAKAFGGDILGLIHGSGEALLEGPKAGYGAPVQAAQLYLADQARKATGYSPLYRGAAGVATITGAVDPIGMEEAAAQGKPGAVLGHTILPLMGLIGGEGAIKERGITEGPIKGGPIGAENLQGLTRENVGKLRGMGFSNQEISNMDASGVNSALSGSRKPTPQPQPTSAAPRTSPVSAEPPASGPPTLQGKKGPLRPYDPSGTRFAKGGTIGMEPIDAAQLIAPPPKGPATYTPSEKAATMAAPRPSLGPEFEAQQASHDLERNKAIMRDPKASPEDKRIAQSRIVEGIPTTPQPVNRGTQAAITPSDPYYKPPPGDIVPSSEVEPPTPQPVPEPTKSIVPYSHELPAHIQDDLDLMTRAKHLATNAPAEESRLAAQNVWNDVAGRTKADLQDHFSKLTPDQRLQLQSDQEAKAERHQKQAQAINDVVAGDKLAQAVRGELAVGEPVVSSHHAVTQYSKETGKPITIVGGTPMDLRSVMSEALGRVVKYESDPVFAAQRAKAIEQGRDPDTIQPEGYKKVEPEKFQEMVLTAKVELQGLQDGFKNKLKALIEDRLEKNPSLVETLGAEGAHDNIHAQALKELLHEVDATGKTLTEKIKGLRELIGRDPQKPVYVKKGEPVIEGGVVKAPGTIPAKSLKLWNVITGKKNNKIGTDKEWQAEADKHMEKSRLHRAIARGVAAFKGEGGFIGEATPPTKPLSRSSVTAKDLDPLKLLAVAKERGLDGWQVSDDQPAGYAGWLSPDGKVWIDKGTLDHDDIAMTILYTPDKPISNPMFGMLENGWIRKVTPRNFEVWKTSPSNINTMEMSMIRDRVHGQGILIDMRDSSGKLRALNIEPGWSDLGPALSQARREQGFTSQSGKIGGLELMGGMGAGGLAGTVVGAIHGGVTGAIVGGTVGMAFGFLAPVVLTSLPVRNAMKVMANIVRGAGVSIKTWIQGPPQVDIEGISPELDKIMREQRLHNEPETTWIERAKLLPSALYKGVDPAAYIADKKNMSMTGKIMMSLDPKGRVFRDLNIPDTASLYVAVSNARADALGLRADKGMQYSAIKSAANKAGVRPMLNAYLNLMAYRRANEVVKEHIQDLDAQEQNRQTKLQSPSLSEREKGALELDLKDIRKKKQELVDKLDLGKVTPGGFKPQKVQDTLDQFRDAHPQEMDIVEQLAKQVFAIRANILDLLFDNGIISQDAYVTYKQRGDEYIPMRRIMDDVDPEKYSVNVNPLDLKQQSVIKHLEGSERENLDPWEALDGDDRRAFNNIIRNRVIKTLLDLAQAYPNTVGQELTPVQPDYQPKKDEMILGHYEEGKPNFFAAPRYLGETLKSNPLATEFGFSVLSRWMEHAFKKGATIYKVGFLATSTLTHALSSMMLSKYGAPPIPTEVIKFIRDWRRAAVEVYRNGPAYQELVKGGAAFGGFDTMFSPERFLSPDEVGIKSRLKKGQILETMGDLAVAGENANRTNIIMRALKQGATLKQALFEARQFGGAPNYARMGDISKWLNHAFMFVNAHAQYPFQVMAAIRKNPARVYPWIAVITAMTMANTTINHMYRDSNGVSTYRKISTYDRERNNVVLTPWTYPAKTGARLPITVKIPKNYLTQMVANPTDEALTYLIGKDARTGTQQALDAIAAISPIHLNLKEGHLGKSIATSLVAASHPLAKTGVQLYSNIDDFGRPIVPPSEQGREDFSQVSPYTSAVAERMGQGGIRGAAAGSSLGGVIGSVFGPTGAIVGGGIGGIVGATGQSPRRIDVATRDLTASIGTQAETILDPFFGGKRGQLHGTEKAIATPVVGGLARAFLATPIDAEYQALSADFNTRLQHAQMIKQTFDFLLKSGKDVEAAKYAQDNQAELFTVKSLETLDKMIKRNSTIIRQMQISPDINTPAGRQALEVAYEANVELLRHFRDLLSSTETKSGDTSPMGGSVTSTVK